MKKITAFLIVGMIALASLTACHKHTSTNSNADKQQAVHDSGHGGH